MDTSAADSPRKRPGPPSSAVAFPRPSPCPALPGVGLVLAAGGGGVRFGGDKLLAPLAGAPVLAHALRALGPLCAPGCVVMVCPPSRVEEYAAAAARHAPGVAAVCVPGGAARAESVLAGLDALPGHVEVAAVHDAARPLASAELLARCVASCRSWGSGVAARRATDSVREATPEGETLRTLDRARVWLMETPQVFPRHPLAAAYRAALAAGAAPTDDGGAFERAGRAVRLVESHGPNLKITYPWDLAAAEAILARHVEGAPRHA